MKDKLNQPILISITPGIVVKTLFILLAAYLLFVIRDLVLVIITSIVIASSIEPAARFFVRRKIPRVISVMLVYASIVLLLIGFFAVFLPPLIDDISSLTTTFPKYIEILSEKQLDFPGLNAIFTNFSSQGITGELVNKISTTFSGATVGVLATASGIFGGILSFILIIIISFYLAVQENGVENFIRIVTPVNQEKYVLDLWKRSQKKIGYWAQGQLILAIIVTILVYLGLSVIGVSNPMFLAILAGMFELIPIFGPFLAGIPAVGFALVDGGLTLGLVTIGLYLIVQQFESQLIHPLVVKKMVGIPSLIAILSLIVGAQIAGFLGIIISVPIAAAIMEYVGDVEKRKKKELEALEAK